MAVNTLVRGRWIITGGAEDDKTWQDGAVVIADDVIAEVGEWDTIRARYPAAAVIGSESVAVMPGLINAHHHSNGISALQHGVPDLLLESWLFTLARRRPADVYLSTVLSASRLLRTGVTAVVDVFSGRGAMEGYKENIEKALRAYDEAGMRVAFTTGFTTQCHIVAGQGQDEVFLQSLPPDKRAIAERRMPASLPSQDHYFEMMAGFISEYRAHPLIDIWFGPPGPQWVGDAFLLRMVEQAEALDTNIQTHLLESFYEKLHGPRDYGKPSLVHLHEIGVLSPRFSIAHGVWLTEEEIGIMAATGAAVSHNPSSNLRLRAGIAPLNALLASGTTVALGMDGCTINDDEDIFTEMRLAMRLHRTPLLNTPAPLPRQIFEMATAGGARLMRKSGQLGRIEVGYQADLVLVGLDRITWPWVAPEADPRDLVLARAQAGDVQTVLIAGKTVLAEGKIIGVDAAAAGRELAEQLAATPFPEAGDEMVREILPYIEAYYGGWEVPERDPFTSYNSRR